MVGILQGAPANTFIIVGRASSQAVSELQRTSSLLKAWDRAEVEIRLWVWQVAAMLSSPAELLLRIGLLMLPALLFLRGT